MATAGNNIHGVQTPDYSEITIEELERPAKELPIEVLKQLGLKLIIGSWTRLAEVLGYSRDDIDAFENQAFTLREPAGFLLLKDWTKEESGRSLYVLRECLRQCGRLDCVAYLDQEIKKAFTMFLMLKVIDETDKERTFMSVPTKCHATLQDSLRNVLPGSVTEYDINASWTEKAKRFKGMHLSIKRKKQSSPDSSTVCFPRAANIRQRPGSPYNDLSGNSMIPSHQHMNISNGRGNNLMALNTKGEVSKRFYFTNECIYCGKFRTTSQIRQNLGSSDQFSGVHCTTCNCDISNIERNCQTSVIKESLKHKPISDNHVSSSSGPMPMECSPAGENETTFPKMHEYCNERVPKQQCTETHLQKPKLQTAITYTNVRSVTVKEGFTWHPPSQEFLDQDQALMKIHGKSAISSYQSNITTDPLPVECGQSTPIGDTENISFHETFVKTPFGEVTNEQELLYHQRERSISEPTELHQALLHGVNRHQLNSSSCEDMHQRRSQNHINGTFQNPYPMCETTTAEVVSPLRLPTEYREIMHTDSQKSGEASVRSLGPTTFKSTAVHPGSLSQHLVSVDKTHRDFICERKCDVQPGSRRQHIEQQDQNVSMDISHNHSDLDQQPEIIFQRGAETPPQLPPRSNNNQAKLGSTGTAHNTKKTHNSSESKFTLICKILLNVPGWCPKETELSIEQTMKPYIKLSGHYMIWYMRETNTIVLTVSHLEKLIHYGIYMKNVSNKILFYIFEGENFADLTDLLNFYIRNGLKPQSQQVNPVGERNFTQQQNLRGSRMMVRLSHVKLLHPVKPKRSRTSV